VVDAAVIVAGGAGLRLGGVDKPALTVEGGTLLDRALAAVGGVPTVVVGPVRDLPTRIRQTQEQPPGSGPAAAVSAGLGALPNLADHALVAVLAADLPGITPATVERLATAVGPGDIAGDPSPAGAVLVDADGRRQYLLGVFHLGPLLAAARAADWTGRPVRALLDPLIDVEVPALGEEAADVDTPEQYRRLGIAGPLTGSDSPS
jgi:molybdopterin-guanine dinucleotide biosynthesis protein A